MPQLQEYDSLAESASVFELKYFLAFSNQVWNYGKNYERNITTDMLKGVGVFKAFLVKNDSNKDLLS